MSPRRNANALAPRSKQYANSNGRPRVCTGNARRPRVLSPAASWLKNPLTQGRGTIPSEPVKILSRPPDCFAKICTANALHCESRTVTGRRGNEGATGSRCRDWRCGTNPGLVAGAAVSGPTRFARSSGGGQVSAAGERDGGHRGFAIFDISFRSARCGAWRGDGRRRMARDRCQRRAERLDFAVGGQQSATVRRGTRLTGGVCCGAIRMMRRSILRLLKQAPVCVRT